MPIYSVLRSGSGDFTAPSTAAWHLTWSWVKATRGVFGVTFAKTLLVWWFGTDAFFPLPSSFESVPLSYTLLGLSPGCPHGSAGPTRVLGALCVPLHSHPMPGRTSADPNQATGAAEMNPEHPQGCQGLLGASSEATTRLELVSWVSCRRAAPLLTGLSPLAEVPKLREHIRRFYTEQKRNKLLNYTTEAMVIFSLIWTLPSNNHAQVCPEQLLGASLFILSPSSRQFTSHISSTTRTQPAGKTSCRGLTNASRHRSLKYPQLELISCSLLSHESPGLSSCPPGAEGTVLVQVCLSSDPALGKAARELGGTGGSGWGRWGSWQGYLWPYLCFLPARCFQWLFFPLSCPLISVSACEKKLLEGFHYAEDR